MKLETLKSEKFKALGNNEMSTVKAGQNVATNGHMFMNNGTPDWTNKDINVYNDDTGKLTTQIYWTADGTKHVVSVTL
ncbi:hypothetical protein MUU74_12265 [Chryseobacterium daecheongense]|uniref:hypothetical protein n=1 Tax=Chryseobacterium daecheongense TaxID=192389 RepID=UPI001FD675D1|nr:hypothetical protein [Chryseobacterium daecheongense]UOU97266.1 hypothetical protein MUU74_12265 [Chryseobacterium daecheongense]